MAASLLQCTRLMARCCWLPAARPRVACARGRRNYCCSRETRPCGAGPRQSHLTRNVAAPQAKLDHEQRDIATGWVFLSANKKIAGASRRLSSTLSMSTLATWPSLISVDRCWAAARALRTFLLSSGRLRLHRGLQSISPARPSSSSATGRTAQRRRTNSKSIPMLST